MNSFEHIFFSRFTNIPSAPPMDVTHPCRVKTQSGMMILKKDKKGKKRRHQGKISGKKKKEQRKEDGNCKKEEQLGKRKKETKNKEGMGQLFNSEVRLLVFLNRGLVE